MNIRDFKIITKYCLGNSKYRKNILVKFKKTIRKSSPVELEHIFSKIHLSQELYYIIDKLKINKLFYNYFKLIPLYYNKLQALYIEELKKIRNSSVNMHLDLAILKGMAFYEEIYNKKTIRPFADVDLLINSSSGHRKIISMLKKDGYSYDCNIEPIEIHYQYPPFRKSKHLIFNAQELEFINYCCVTYGTLPDLLLSLVKSKFIIKLTIELHKTLFLFEDNSYPLLKSVDFRKSQYLKGFKILRSGTILPYLSTKLFVDLFFVEKGKHEYLGSIKLLKDIIVLLDKMSPAQLQNSFSVSQRIHTTDYLNDAIDLASSFVPNKKISASSKASKKLDEILELIYYSVND